jgi:5-methylcytosine-specific restriction endonuclease McrA
MGKTKTTATDTPTSLLSPLSPPLKKRNRKQTIPKALKIAVWKTNIGMETGMTLCCVCKTNTITQMDFQCGHIVAEAEGGETCLSNLQPICCKCNQSMGKKNLISFKDTYFR